MQFSPKQDEALMKVSQWLNNPAQPFFYLAGYAGTGKTTLAKHLVTGIDGKVYFAAFTGKAASVLRKAGCPEARTLHSLLYRPKDEMLRERMLMLKTQLAAAETDEEKEAIKEAMAELRRMAKQGPQFVLNEESELLGARLLVLDECSMVNDEMANDAMRFKVPILVLGDPAQLPPVKGQGFFTRRRPDHLLTEIHRQAADNPIIKWATLAREGMPLPFADDGKVKKVRRGKIDFDHLDPNVQVLTGKNKVRRELNIRIRRSQGRNDDLPEKEDKLVCLKNNHDLGLLNGVICKAISDAQRINGEELELSVEYEGNELLDLPVSSVPFDKYLDPEAEDEFIDRYLEQFDYGYALTVHKSQGSQWDDVVLADDGFAAWDRELRQKWLYTAITRAAERLTIVA